MGGKKRSKQGSSSSIEEEGTIRSDNVQMLKDSIDCLKKVVSEGFAKLHEDMDKLRHEFKEDLDGRCERYHKRYRGKFKQYVRRCRITKRGR